MPTCPNCNTWNPDDKLVCWRCQTPLPRPEPKPRRPAPRVYLGLPLWAWLLLALFFLFNLLLPYLVAIQP